MNKKSATDVASIWLLPAADDQTMLASIVAELADRHGSPRFLPHLTIVGDVPRAPDQLHDVTRAIATATSVFTAPIRDIATSDLYFRSFYAEFAISPELTAMRTAAERALAAPPSPFMPHVSLLYGAVEEPAKSASAAEIRNRIGGRPIRFDRVVLTNSSNSVPVADWEILLTCPLG